MLVLVDVWLILITGVGTLTFLLSLCFFFIFLAGLEWCSCKCDEDRREVAKLQTKGNKKYMYQTFGRKGSFWRMFSGSV